MILTYSSRVFSSSIFPMSFFRCLTMAKLTFLKFRLVFPSLAEVTVLIDEIEDESLGCLARPLLSRRFIFFFARGRDGRIFLNQRFFSCLDVHGAEKMPASYWSRMPPFMRKRLRWVLFWYVPLSIASFLLSLSIVLPILLWTEILQWVWHSWLIMLISICKDLILSDVHSHIRNAHETSLCKM